MTERLYYHDAYLTRFDAAVVGRDDDGRRIYLDRTAFYPTSGGQPFDTGRLGGVSVVDVVDEGDRIAHLLAGPVAGERVAGEVDWPRRFDHMQQHTGQHLLSAVIADRFGAATVSVHFGRESSTLDLEAASFTHDQAVEAEALANVAVTENRPVRVSFEAAATAAGLRKAPDREGTLRIVTIEGLDRSACGGTHVRATGEIGLVAIRKVERVKQLVRLEFYCGTRAARRTRVEADLLADARDRAVRGARGPARIDGGSARRAQVRRGGAARSGGGARRLPCARAVRRRHARGPWPASDGAAGPRRVGGSTSDAGAGVRGASRRRVRRRADGPAHDRGGDRRRFGRGRRPRAPGGTRCGRRTWRRQSPPGPGQAGHRRGDRHRDGRGARGRQGRAASYSRVAARASTLSAQRPLPASFRRIPST